MATSGIPGKPGKPITETIGRLQAQREVDATPTPDQEQAEGMQIKLGPATKEKAPYSQHDPMFQAFRFQGLVAGTVQPIFVPNIPRYYVVHMNPDAAAASTIRIQAGSFDVTLAANMSVKFPGRTDRFNITVAGGAADFTVISLGDDEVRFI